MAAVSCASPASAFTRQRRQRADLLAGPGTRPLLQKARTARREDAKLRAFCDDVRAQSPGPRPFVRQGSRKKPDVRGERARGSARKAGSSALFGPKVAEKARWAAFTRRAASQEAPPRRRRCRPPTRPTDWSIELIR
jgi:hypothetical protein